MRQNKNGEYEEVKAEDEEKSESEGGQRQKLIKAQNELNELKSKKNQYEKMKKTLEQAKPKINTAKNKLGDANNELTDAYTSTATASQSDKIEIGIQEISAIINKIDQVILPEIINKLSLIEADITEKQNLIDDLKAELED